MDGVEEDERPFSPQWAVRPGEILREVIASRGLTPEQFCAEIGWVYTDTLVFSTLDLPITRQRAMELAQWSGASVGYWLELQHVYDDWTREHESCLSQTRFDFKCPGHPHTGRYVKIT